MEKASTEEKIRNAASALFTEKGFSQTTTRDIAEKAGTNVALINYYFRSKDNLFSLIMAERLSLLLDRVLPILDDPSTELSVKIDRFIDYYMNMLLENPDLPLFVMGGLKSRQLKALSQRIPFGKDGIAPLYFIKQLESLHPGEDSMQLMMSIMSVILFPFAARSLFMYKTGMSDREFSSMMMKRKKILPEQIKAMLNLK